MYYVHSLLIYNVCTYIHIGDMEFRGQKALMFKSQAMHKKEYTSYLLILNPHVLPFISQLQNVCIGTT